MKTVVCVAPGPSLNQKDAKYLKALAEKLVVIAVADAWVLCPFADAVYAADEDWWEFNKGLPDFQGLKYSLHLTRFKDVMQLIKSGDTGIDSRWPQVRTGGNSGYQAVNLAYHLGPDRIVLLGYDMQRTMGMTHFFGDHPEDLGNPDDARLASWVPHFDSLPEVLGKLGVDIVNCSRETAIAGIKRKPLEEVL